MLANHYTTAAKVRRVLCVDIVHMSPGSLWGATASVALVAGVSLVSTLQADDWAKVSTLARHYFPPTLLLQIGTRTQ